MQIDALRSMKTCSSFVMGPYLHTNAAGKVGEPEDIAELCLFLADNQKAKFITGQHFTVDGGVTAKLIYPE